MATELHPRQRQHVDPMERLRRALQHMQQGGADQQRVGHRHAVPGQRRLIHPARHPGTQLCQRLAAVGPRVCIAQPLLQADRILLLQALEGQSLPVPEIAVAQGRLQLPHQAKAGGGLPGAQLRGDQDACRRPWQRLRLDRRVQAILRQVKTTDPLGLGLRVANERQLAALHWKTFGNDKADSIASFCYELPGGWKSTIQASRTHADSP